MPAVPRPNRARSRRTAAVVVLVAVAVLAGCTKSGPNSSANSTTGPSVTICRDTASTSAGGTPDLQGMKAAIAALEQRLGGPQQYFEINATSRLVNLFVALNGGTVAQPWVWLDGDLSSKEGQPASGGTFTAADLRFDPAKVFSQLEAKIPGSTLESFYVQGDGKGNVQYHVLTSAQCGGGLDVVVGPDGAVQSVDPVN